MSWVAVCWLLIVCVVDCLLDVVVGSFDCVLVYLRICVLLIVVVAFGLWLLLLRCPLALSCPLAALQGVGCFCCQITRRSISFLFSFTWL